MKILISALRFRLGRTLGAEEYLRGVLQGLHAAGGADIEVAAGPDVCRWVRAVAPSIGALQTPDPATPWQRVLHERSRAPRLARQSGADVVFFPFNLMPPMPVPSVLTVHDLVNRFYARHFPSYRPVRTTALRVLVERSLVQADHVVTDCVAIANDIVVEGLFPADAITPILLAAGQAGDADKSASPSPGSFLVLQANNGNWHKDPGTGIRAMAALRELAPGVFSQTQLVLTSVGPHLRSHLDREIRRHSLEDRVTLYSRIPLDELQQLVARATIHFFPSLYEGFGLGVLEAQRAGKAVVAADTSVHREVSGGIAEFFPPQDASRAAQCILGLLCGAEKRRELETRGIEHGKARTWTAFGHELLAVFERVRQQKHRRAA